MNQTATSAGHTDLDNALIAALPEGKVHDDAATRRLYSQDVYSPGRHRALGAAAGQQW
jgi:hypothetical protein